MRNNIEQVIAILLFSAAATCCFGQNSHPVAWLAGTWENLQSRPGETVLEVWQMEPEGHLSGKGIIIRSADTIVTERLQIVQREGTYYYVADVSHNPAPVFFEITEFGPDGFVVQNPGHDFPKKIVYNLREEGIVATASGDGREFTSRFRKME
jgi:hypothetical protein